MKPLTDELRESMIDIIVSREIESAEDYLEDWVSTVMRDGFDALTERSDEALVETYLEEVSGTIEADDSEDDWESMCHIASLLLFQHGLVDRRLSTFLRGADAASLLARRKSALMRSVDEVDAMLARISRRSCMTDEEFVAACEDAATDDDLLNNTEDLP